MATKNGYVILEETFNGCRFEPYYGSHCITTTAVVFDVNVANDFVLKIATEEWEEKFYPYTSWTYRPDYYDAQCGIIVLEDDEKHWMKFWCEPIKVIEE